MYLQNLNTNFWDNILSFWNYTLKTSLKGTLHVWFHPWVEFVPVCGQNFLSVYMFNQSEISPLALFYSRLGDRGKTHPGVIRYDFNM